MVLSTFRYSHIFKFRKSKNRNTKLEVNEKLQKSTLLDTKEDLWYIMKNLKKSCTFLEKYDTI